MLQKDLIREFLDKETIAVVGVSRKGDIPANHIFKKFQQAGYKVFPVNPNADNIDGQPCYHTIDDMPVRPEAVMLAGTPETSESTMMECIENHVPIVWMHRGIGTGSYSALAEEAGKQHNVKVISNGCPMMFVKKVDPFHKVLKWFK